MKKFINKIKKYALEIYFLALWVSILAGVWLNIEPLSLSGSIIIIIIIIYLRVKL